MTALASASETMMNLFSDSLTELIETYTENAPQISFDDCEDIDANMTAIVGLSSPEVSASVALITSANSAYALAKMPPACPQDWLGELGNQLAGRLKNKMSLFGLSSNLSTPTVVRGQFLQLTTSAAETINLTARFSGGVAIAQLALTINVPDLELIEQDVEPVSEEGSFELF